jgi:hypothetical protein
MQYRTLIYCGLAVALSWGAVAAHSQQSRPLGVPQSPSAIKAPDETDKVCCPQTARVGVVPFQRGTDTGQVGKRPAVGNHYRGFFFPEKCLARCSS